MKEKINYLLILVIFFAKFSYTIGVKGEVPEVKVVKTNSPPILDGKIDDQTWLEAALYGSKLTGFVNATGTELIEYQPIVFVAYDDKNFYLAVRTYLPGTKNLQREKKEFSIDNDLIQIFLEPKMDGRYVQYMVNWDGASSHPGINAVGLFDKIFWTVEISIPWELLNIIPREGEIIGFNVCGAQSSTGAGWITWSPTYGGFHNPSRFGYLILGSKLHIKKIPTKIEEDDF